MLSAVSNSLTCQFLTLRSSLRFLCSGSFSHSLKAFYFYFLSEHTAPTRCHTFSWLVSSGRNSCCTPFYFSRVLVPVSVERHVSVAAVTVDRTCLSPAEQIGRLVVAWCGRGKDGPHPSQWSRHSEVVHSHGMHTTELLSVLVSNECVTECPCLFVTFQGQPEMAGSRGAVPVAALANPRSGGSGGI